MKHETRGRGKVPRARLLRATGGQITIRAMGDLWDANDWDPYEGFNRVSVAARSRKPSKPKIGQTDLLAPSGFGSARMAGMCLVMAICMCGLYMWPVLFFVNFFVPLHGHLYAGLLLAAIGGFFLFLYFAGTRETRRDRDLAARL